MLDGRPACDRSISKRVSFGLRSVHDRSILVVDAPVAARPVGEIGTVTSVRALAMFENGPSPPELKARTWKKYVVSAWSPNSMALVAVEALRPSDVQATPSRDCWIS